MESVILCDVACATTDCSVYYIVLVFVTYCMSSYEQRRAQCLETFSDTRAWPEKVVSLGSKAPAYLSAANATNGKDSIHSGGISLLVAVHC